jgi:glutaminyl-tRNA synthetase
VADRLDHVTGAKPVFNRVTGLKDSWGKWCYGARPI